MGQARRFAPLPAPSTPATPARLGGARRMFETCEDNPSQPGCETHPPPPNPHETVLPSGMTWEMCRDQAPNWDQDADGFYDGCEFEVARAFRPVLAISPGDDDARRQPYWSVQRSIEPGDYGLPHSPRLRVFYAFAYLNDAGDDECSGCTSHAGDSEFIILDVAATTAGFVMTGAFLSAHWGDESSESSEWRPYYNFAFHAGYGGRPTIWVAEDKHGNYVNSAACDTGGWLNSDNCDGNWWSTTDPSRQFEVRFDANLGNRYMREPPFSSVGTASPINNCVGPLIIPFATTECFWNPGHRFAGWWPAPHGTSSSPYFQPLDYFGF